LATYLIITCQAIFPTAIFLSFSPPSHCKAVIVV
jgi:hypothetical protein